MILYIPHTGWLQGWKSGGRGTAVTSANSNISAISLSLRLSPSSSSISARTLSTVI
jgi:hypothetical protein